MGEGLEKRADDFVEEVKQAGGTGLDSRRCRCAKETSAGKGGGQHGDQARLRRNRQGRRQHGQVGRAPRLADAGPTRRPKLPLAPGVKYRRILLKLSGEALMGEQGYGIDPATLSQIADEVIDVHSLGVEIALVIGGGNIFRGVAGAAPRAWTAPTPTTWACWPP